MSTVIRPQIGPQTAFLSSSADIVIYGGARGGGKSYAALLEPLRNVSVPGFNAVLFRRTYPQITNAGGLWPKSFELYPALGGLPSVAKMQWDFPSGATIAFRHMKLEEHKIDWQGLQICLLMWEELTHFSKSQFLFLLGSNRSTCGVRPYVRATCNPDADSWVKEFIAPYLDAEGYANPEEVGKIKHLIIEDEQVRFVEESYRDELGNPPYSFTFINADVWDNQALLEKDPGYLRNLMAQNAVDRERFLGKRGRGGNWNVKASKGKVFRSDWFDLLDRVPAGTHLIRTVRFWDFAATVAQQKGDDPDWTVGLKMGIDAKGVCYILDVNRSQSTPAQVEKLMIQCAQLDGGSTAIRWFRDPGQAGIDQDQKIRKMLRGYDASGVLDRDNKYSRARAFSKAAEYSEIKLVLDDKRASAFLNELSDFPDAGHDDQVDAGSGAYNELLGRYAQTARVGQVRSS